MTDREALRRKLERARKRRDHVRIVRRPKDIWRVDGFVVGVGKQWVLLLVDSEGSPGGYVVIKLRDVKRIDDGGHRHRFVRRSLKLHGAWPPPLPQDAIELDGSVKDVIESAAATAALVTIYIDRDDSACYIGRPARWGRRKLRFHEVNLCGDWDPQLWAYPIKSITRVDFGGMYETNLAAVAGPEPGV